MVSLHQQTTECKWVQAKILPRRFKATKQLKHRIIASNLQLTTRSRKLLITPTIYNSSMNMAIQAIIKAKILLERLEEPSSSPLNACLLSLNLHLWTTNHSAEGKWEVQQVNKKQVSSKISSSTEACVALMRLTTQVAGLSQTRPPFKVKLGCKGLRGKTFKILCS